MVVSKLERQLAEFEDDLRDKAHRLQQAQREVAVTSRPFVTSASCLAHPPRLRGPLLARSGLAGSSRRLLFSIVSKMAMDHAVT